MPDLLERLTAALAERYAIEREVGRGGMAVVFLAEDLRHHRQVALKVLHPELTATLGAERFLHEIEIVAGLQHPHILPLYESGEADGLLYYVMPYAEGESLRQRLDREKQLAVDESVRIAVEVADGLDYAHRKGVVHRDIKPGNILLSERHAVIADFGIARAIEAARAERVTSTGLGVGTPLYASPEQATAQETLDGRTDIYSLGCVLYEMLAGEPPLTGATPQIIQARRVSETPSALHNLRDTVPPALDQVIGRALARIPADRYATASQFGQALQAVLLTNTPAAQLSGAPIGGWGARALPHSERRWRVGLLALLVVAACVAAAFAFYSGWLGEELPQIAVSNQVQVTSDPGLEIMPEISPNGDEVVYVAATLDSSRIIIRNTYDVSGSTRPASEGAVYDWDPTWTADGSSIRFNGYRKEAGWGWKVVGRHGGPVRKLDPPPTRGAAWSHDGTRVAFVVQDSIFVSPTESPNAQLLGVHQADWAYLHSLSWSPDGRWIAYVNGNAGWRQFAWTERSSIWIIDSEGGNPVRVTDDTHMDQSPRWLPNSRHLLFVSNRDGQRDVYIVAAGAEGQRSPRRVPGFSDPQTISLSADGTRLAYAKLTKEANVWSASTRDQGPVSSRDMVPVTTGTSQTQHHAVSPDGDWIAFDRDVRGEYDIYRMPLAGGRPQLITDMAGNAYAPEWSPDGREIVFGTIDGVYVVPVEGGVPVKVASTEGQFARPVWSPDGLRIAFGSTGGIGTLANTWLISRTGLNQPWREPVQLTYFTESDCYVPDWDPRSGEIVCGTGSEIVRLSSDGTIRDRYDLTSDGLRKYIGWPRFSPDGMRIYFYGRNADDSWSIYWIPSGGGHATEAITFDDPNQIPLGMDVGPEAVYVLMAEPEADIWVMDLEW